MEGGQVQPLHGQGRYGTVPPTAPDIIALRVLPIPLPHHAIGRCHSRTLPPNAASIKEQGDEHCGSVPSRCIPSWERKFWSAHQGEMYTLSYSCSCWMGVQERWMIVLHVAASSTLSG